MPDGSATGPSPHLERGVGLRGAIALNMTDMIGVGPFLTLPLIVQSMGGPQAMLGWIAGALLAVCDGLIWAELGASFPRAGGSYQYLSECFGPRRWGRLFSFLFVWQLSFSAPLVIASGCIGLAQYAGYLWPALETPRTTAAAAMGAALLALWLCYRRVKGAGRICEWLWAGVVAVLVWVIAGGAPHLRGAAGLRFPPGSLRLTPAFVSGLGAAMVLATYDYWGYENANFLGGEIERPERNLPRAVLISIGLVAALYLAMNLGVLAVVPWQTMLGGDAAVQNRVISVFMERLYGPRAAAVATVLIVWAAFASVFSLLLGYSRVPYAAARDGNYFRVFGRLHPRLHIPHVALLALTGATMLCCLAPLGLVISVLVAIRLVMQCILQAAGLWWLRRRHPEAPRPFRMWLYPLPLIAAVAGFVYMLIAPAHAGPTLGAAAAVLASGVGLFALRARRRREWPFAGAAA